MGSGIFTTQLMQMVAGAIIPGRPVANLYVEPRRCRHFSIPCSGSQDRSIPQNSASRHVSYPSMGYYLWLAV